MGDALIGALFTLLAPQHLLFLSVGVLCGLAVGVVPGLGGIAGMSLLLPLLYGLDPVSALAMLVGLVAVIPTSDTFTSVLMGIPGSSASQATVLDGFPLAKRGEAARALGAAFSASLFGGLVGALALTLFVQVARPLVLTFGSAELFALALFGLSMVGVLAGRSLAKGVVACALGLLLGAVGTAPATGEPRLTFGIDYLWDGLPLVVVGLGIFAVPEIVDLLCRGGTIAEGARLGAGWLRGLRDMLANWFLCVRCALIGVIVGVIPGLGGSVVDWIAYGHAVQTVRDNPRFGEGDIRGVLAPESANNAKEGGGLVPTLLFGIPGSGSMAVFLGGMVLLGIQPGPSMVADHLSLTYAIVWSLALANVMGAGLCLLFAGPIARLTTIPYPHIAAFMLVVISFAALQATRSLADLVALLAVGVLGTVMKRFGWPRPAFLIGFVLADPVETYLYQAVQFYGWEFATRPLVLAILALTAVSVWLGIRHRPASLGERPQGSRLGEAVFVLAAVAFFGYALHSCSRLTFLGGVFPVATAGLALLFAVWTGWVLVLRQVGHPLHWSPGGGVEPGVPARCLLRHLAWLAGLVALTALVGFWLAVAVSFPAFLRVEARLGWPMVLVATLLVLGAVTGLADLLTLALPAGLLQDHLDLPWPLE